MEQDGSVQESKIEDVRSQSPVVDHLNRVLLQYHDRVYFDEGFPMFVERLTRNYTLLSG